jgi:tRNA (guanine37-N1)-methyltransferase
MLNCDKIGGSMKIDILTLFPNMFSGPFDESIVKRARDFGLVEIQTHQLRNWAKDKHQTVDDRPFGGGVGMLMKVEPIYNALEDLKKNTSQNTKVVLMDAGGEKFTQKKAQEYAKLENLIIVCGRYEGVDYRVHEHLVDDRISIGDFIVTGGELPAMLVVDAVTRLIPNVLEKDTATDFESFSLSSDQQLLLEYPQYTRPEEFHGWKVPEVLLTGHHDNIENWRMEKAKETTKKIRPDLTK